MTTLFLVIQVVLAIVITISVLLQKSSSIGLGQYSGSNESLFGAKGPAGFLAKFTATLGLLFVINTLALAYFYKNDSQRSITDSITQEQIEQNAVPQAPKTQKQVAVPLQSESTQPAQSEVIKTEANETIIDANQTTKTSDINATENNTTAN